MNCMSEEILMQVQRVGEEWRWRCPRTGATGTAKTMRSAMAQGRKYLKQLFNAENAENVVDASVRDLRTA